MKKKRTKGVISLILAMALMAALLPSNTLAGSIASEGTSSDAAALQEAGTSDADPVPGEDAYSDETEQTDSAEGSDAYDANSGSGVDASGAASGADEADMTGSEDVSGKPDGISGGDSSFSAEDSDTADGSAAEYADGADISDADGDAGDVADESEIALLAADEDMPTSYTAVVVYFDEQNNRMETETLETVTLPVGSVEAALNADESLKSRTYNGKTYDLNWVYNADNLKVMEVTYAKNADGEWEVHYSFEEGAIGGQQVNTGLEIWYTARSEMLSVSYDPYPGSDETPLNYAEGSLGVKAGETLEFYVSVERGYTYTVSVTAGSETLSVRETTANVKSSAEGEDTVYNTEGEFFIDIPEDTTDDIFVAVTYTQAETITFSPGVFADTTYPYLYDNGSRRFTMQENNGETYSGGASQEDLLKDYTVNYSEDGTTFTFAFSCGMGGTNWTGWLLDSLQINGVAVSIPGELNTSATTTIVEDVSGDPDKDCTVTVSVDYMSGDLYYHTITVNNAKEDITITAANLKSSTWPEVIPTADAGIWFENDSLDAGGNPVTTGLNEPVTTSPNSISRIRFHFGLEKGYKNLTIKLDAYDAYKGILANFNAVSASDITGSYAFSFTPSGGAEATLATLLPGEPGGYQMDFTIDNRQSTGVHMQYLYLSCEPELYNIAYDLGEGEGDIADGGTYSVSHHNANVTSDEPEAPEGHTFYGWATEDPEGKDLSELTIYYPNDAVDFTSDAVWESVDRENPDSGFDGTLRFYAVYLDTLPEGTSGTAVVNTYLQGITGAYQLVEGGGVEVAVTAGHSFTVYDSYIYSDNQNVINNGGYGLYTYFEDASNPRIANATGMDDEIDLYYSLKFDGAVSLDNWVYGEEKEAESDYLTVVDGDGNTLSSADNGEVGSAYVKSDYVYYMANEDGSKGGRLEGKPANAGSYIVEVTWTLTLAALDANGDPVEVTDEITAEDPFEITPRPLTVTSGDAQKVYDGEPLTCNSYEITDGSLAYGDTITVTVTGSQTVVGSSPNTMSEAYAVTSSGGEDVSGNYTVTFVPGTLTVTAGSTDVTVTKVWDDGDDQDGIRPESVTIRLMANGEPALNADGAEITAEVGVLDDWTVTFTDLPKYKVDTEIKYEITEDSIEGYEDTVIEGSASEGFTVTNIHTPETKDITVVKAWNDDENRDSVRPDSAQVQLKADGEDIGEAVTLSSDNNWTYTWEGVWVYSGGEKITYSVEETSESEGYAPTYSSETDEDGSETFTVVNNHDGAATRITVNKVWQDDDDVSGTRPENVTVQLLANGGAVGDPVTLNSSGGWSFTWEDLPAFDNGTLIKYTVEEFEVEGYETETGSLIPIIEDSSVTGFGITVTNTRTADLAVTKEVSGTGTADSYEFEISLTSRDGTRFDGEVTVSLSDGLEETLTFTDGKASVSLGDGETAVLHAIAYGTDCTVTEKTTGADSVTVYIDGEAASSVKGDGAEAAADVGKINGAKQVKFVNSYRGFFPIEEEIVPDYTDRDTWVKEEGVGEYNAIEIEMSTKLPQITGYDLENGSFTMNFHDILDHELVLDGESADFLVFIGGEQISEEYYNVTTASGANPAKLKLYDSSASIDDGCTFHVDVDLSRLYRDGVITEEDLQGDTEIIIFFFADLEGTGLNGSYKSTVWYEIYDGDDLLYTSDEEFVEVYTYEIDITKYDASTLTGTDYGASGLEGAILGVYYDEDCTDPFIRNGGPYTAVSVEDGRAVFYGLADGTYYVKEIEAPEGYELSGEVLEVTLGVSLKDSGYTYSAVFANTPEEETPPKREDPGTGNPDTGNPGTGNPDTGNPDTGSPDTGNPDSGNPDIGSPDSGTADSGNQTDGISSVGSKTDDIGAAELGWWTVFAAIGLLGIAVAALRFKREKTRK